VPSEPDQIDEHDDALLLEHPIVEEPCPAPKTIVLYSLPPSRTNATLAAEGSARRKATTPST
jgi:hypothetical protein